MKRFGQQVSKKCRIKTGLLIWAFVVASSAYAENDKAFVWQVASAEATVYLMGSIHFADESFYPLRKEIEQAFNRSDALVVELDITRADADVYRQLLTQKGLLDDGKTIKDILSEQTLRQLEQRLQSLNVPYASVKKYKPGVLVLNLTAIQIRQMGFDPQLGIDVYFLNKASSQGKKIIELESLEQQLNLFLNIPDAELLLKESLHSLDESERLMADIIDYWKQGNAEQLNKLLFEDALKTYPAFSAIYDRLIYRRNHQMTEKIESMLQNKQPDNVYFVVIGSGHLIGEKGVVNALMKKGYKVRRL